jgi:hypothetical protein
VDISKKRLDALVASLSERDLEIIEMVGRFKVVTADQIERRFFVDRVVESGAGADTVAYSERSRARNRQGVLKRLTDNRVLAHVGTRRKGGGKGGSSGHLYKLDTNGQRIAKFSSARPRRPYVGYTPSIPHYLAVGELYVRLIEAERAGVLKLLTFETEPYSWRTFGNRVLKPDAFVQVGVEANGQRRKGSFFIEVDRDEEYGTKISSKIPAYLDYLAHEQPSGRVFPQVLFLCLSPQRMRYLKALAADHAPASNVFHVGLFDGAVELLSGQ